MVSGKGLTAVMRERYPRAVCYPAICGLAVANTINAGADIGAIAAAVNLIAPVPIAALIVPIAAVIVALQLWGSYRLIAGIFKWIALALFAYVGAALYARPHLADLLRGTFMPALRFDDAGEIERTRHQDHAHERKAHEDFVAEHLRGSAQSSQQRILVIGGPACQHDAVHSQR